MSRSSFSSETPSSSPSSNDETTTMQASYCKLEIFSLSSLAKNATLIRTLTDFSKMCIRRVAHFLSKILLSHLKADEGIFHFDHFAGRGEAGVPRLTHNYRHSLHSLYLAPQAEEPYPSRQKGISSQESE